VGMRSGRNLLIARTDASGIIGSGVDRHLDIFHVGEPGRILTAVAAPPLITRPMMVSIVTVADDCSRIP
jgi:hypothetical protein